MDKLLRIGNEQILKSRIAGWKRGTDDKHNYCIHILLDTGQKVGAVVTYWDYNNQHDSMNDAEKECSRIESMLNDEFNLNQEQK